MPDAGAARGATATPVVSVVIATRNRRDQVLRLLATIEVQTVAHEVIVCDDASTDGTAKSLSNARPSVQLIRSDGRLGTAAQWNRGAKAARASVVAFLDDDTELSSPETLAAAISSFDHPRVGIVSLPLVDFIRGKTLLRYRAPDSLHRYVSDSFPGGASLIRREALLGVGGYREELFQRGEEPELARRMLKAGWVVALSSGPEVIHHGSAVRESAEEVRRQSRAELLGASWGLPLRFIPRRIALAAGHGARVGHPIAGAAGFWDGLRSYSRTREWRDPVGGELARMLRRMESERLSQRYTIRLEELESHLASPGAPIESGLPITGKVSR